MEVRSLIKNDRVFEHIYYCLGREFLFNNTWIVIILCVLLYFPAIFFRYTHIVATEIQWESLKWYQLSEAIILVPLIILIASKWSRKHFTEDRYYHFKTFEEPKEINWKEKIWQITLVNIPFFSGLILLTVFRNEQIAFIACNLIFLSLIYFLINAALREYFTVDKIVYSYFLHEYKGRDENFISNNDTSHKFSSKNWYFKRTSFMDRTSFENDIAPKILRVFQEGMEMEGWSIEKIIKQKNESTHLGLLEDGKNILGYCFVTIPDNLFQEKKILWIDACCIIKQFQEHGFYDIAIKNLLALNRFGWIGGRTQNPVIFYLLDNKSGNPKGKLLPFDNANKYPDELMNFLLANILQVKNHADILNRETGLCKQIYKVGILGKYPLDFKKDKKRSSRLEIELIKIGLNRLEGDAIIVLKEVKDFEK
jgi:hypothetical protein